MEGRRQQKHTGRIHFHGILSGFENMLSDLYSNCNDKNLINKVLEHLNTYVSAYTIYHQDSVNNFRQDNRLTNWNSFLS